MAFLRQATRLSARRYVELPREVTSSSKQPASVDSLEAPEAVDARSADMALSTEPEVLV